MRKVSSGVGWLGHEELSFNRASFLYSVQQSSGVQAHSEEEVEKKGVVKAELIDPGYCMTNERGLDRKKWKETPEFLSEDDGQGVRTDSAECT